MTGRGIYVETTIAAPLETVWALTQDPAQHVRWDVRFSRITPTTPAPGGGTRFTYSRRTPVGTVVGDGVSLGERDRPDGTRTSALRFATADRRSPIRAGRGYWRYAPDGDGVRFVTGYDYVPGWGRLLDRVARPLLGWATAWSFDRLRLWAEQGVEPERWPLRSVLYVWRGDRPRAARCRRAPARGHRHGDHLRDAPTALAELPDPEEHP
ncbi:SRPBCC family protein [Isoptericola sp. F-RaC21]|uniref:SRPBCC family protein n=1 Tax=Isoptericola sp. F-RaC21 TaxID=3141452 RepID=UPI00315BE247